HLLPFIKTFSPFLCLLYILYSTAVSLVPIPKSSIMTITILPARLKLLHFPKSTLPHATHAIIKACFFDISYTENSLEVSIVAENHVVENEFMPSLNAACSEIEVSEETFRALQIDDDTGQSSYSSGRRISELSEPLAQAQFSIFYMSTYQTDFILVKEKRLAQAVTALLQHGFEMDMDSVDEQVPSLAVAQVHRINGNGYGGDDDAEVASLADPENGSHNDYDHPAEQNFGVRWEKIVLRNELRCAGLNRDFIQSWALNIIKVLFYPEMVAGSENPRFFSYTATNDGISLITDHYILEEFEEHMLNVSDNTPPLRLIQVDLAGANLGLRRRPRACARDFGNESGEGAGSAGRVIRTINNVGRRGERDGKRRIT
ncbi:ACT domain-containing protein, partial [Jimgerdemannia flammicorona]